MSEGNGQRIKVTVQWVKILDNLEPAFKAKGEFVFRSVVTSNNFPVKHESRFPATGHISIPDEPPFNKEIIKWVIFEGEVVDHLVIELYGEEIDITSANDHLDDYRRELSGPVEGWLGTYGPGEDFSSEGDDGGDDDPESMSNWQVNIFIDPV
ncbi:MAG: hypothetical protein R3195_09290 [Gemmatimonadota bacterium]|nr:hypothetical protein [Gemmatimonadota bacterium]